MNPHCWNHLGSRNSVPTPSRKKHALFSYQIQGLPVPERRVWDDLKCNSVHDGVKMEEKDGEEGEPWQEFFLGYFSGISFKSTWQPLPNWRVLLHSKHRKTFLSARLIRGHEGTRELPCKEGSADNAHCS